MVKRPSARVERARAPQVVTTEDADRDLAITLMARARNPALAIAVTGVSRERERCSARASEVVIVDDLVAGA